MVFELCVYLTLKSRGCDATEDMPRQELPATATSGESSIAHVAEQNTHSDEHNDDCAHRCAGHREAGRLLKICLHLRTPLWRLLGKLATSSCAEGGWLACFSQCRIAQLGELSEGPLQALEVGAR